MVDLDRCRAAVEAVAPLIEHAVAGCRRAHSIAMTVAPDDDDGFRAAIAAWRTGVGGELTAALDALADIVALAHLPDPLDGSRAA